MCSHNSRCGTVARSSQLTPQWLTSRLFLPIPQQIEMVTPLQLYFSFKSTFTNAQVAYLSPDRC